MMNIRYIYAAFDNSGWEILNIVQKQSLPSDNLKLLGNTKFKKRICSF